MYFLCKAQPSLLELSITRQRFGTRLGDHVKQQNSQQKTQKYGNVALHGSQTGHLFTLV